MTKTGENFRSVFVYFACLYMLEKVHSSKKIIVKYQMISYKKKLKSIDGNSVAKKKPESSIQVTIIGDSKLYFALLLHSKARTFLITITTPVSMALFN